MQTSRWCNDVYFRTNSSAMDSETRTNGVAGCLGLPVITASTEIGAAQLINFNFLNVSNAEQPLEQPAGTRSKRMQPALKQYFTIHLSRR
jgi:hypothetical protein